MIFKFVERAERLQKFEKELTKLLNIHCIDVELSMNDFILARIVYDLLMSFGKAIDHQESLKSLETPASEDCGPVEYTRAGQPVITEKLMENVLNSLEPVKTSRPITDFNLTEIESEITKYRSKRITRDYNYTDQLADKITHLISELRKERDKTQKLVNICEGFKAIADVTENDIELVQEANVLLAKVHRMASKAVEETPS